MSVTRSTVDSILDVCQHQHRRIVLALLTAEGRSLTLNDLAQTVLEYNHQASPTAVSEDILTEIRLSFHHVHLPKLATRCVPNRSRSVAGFQQHRNPNNE